MPNNPKQQARANRARAAANRALGERIAAECAGETTHVPALAERYGATPEQIKAALLHVAGKSSLRIVRANGPEMASRQVGTTAWHILQAAIHGGDTISSIAARIDRHPSNIRQVADRMAEAGLVRLTKCGRRVYVVPGAHDPREGN